MMSYNKIETAERHVAERSYEFDAFKRRGESKLDCLDCIHDKLAAIVQ